MYTNDQKRKIETLALNTVGLKDYGKKGKDKQGNDLSGFYTLKNNKTIKLSEIGYQTDTRTEGVRPDIEKAALDFPELKDFKGFGINKETNKARPGFYIVKGEELKGKVISIKQLNEAVTKAASNVDVN